jgi:hypothetical protein
MQIGIGVEGIPFGEERSRIASRFVGRYREFLKAPESGRPMGMVDEDVFIGYSEHDRVEFLEVAGPRELADADGRPVPLEFGAFVRWLSDTPFVIDEFEICVVPSLSLALTFDADDEGRIARDSRATIASMGVPGYFDR